MAFATDFLQGLVHGRIASGFLPFLQGQEAPVEKYIRQVVARLGSHPNLLVEADFNSYGSGYASYVPVTVAQRNRSDTVTTAKGQRVRYDTKGLLLYISRLAPYWFYGRTSWSVSYENGQFIGGSSGFLEADSAKYLDSAVWEADQQWLEAALTDFRYQLLTASELAESAPAVIERIPTILADPPYKVFDCFFYWED